ncbi:uncharacterized protein MYCFIDRAFT_103423, partial [Pseudocercospora fijiensis CIRAD86]
DRYESQSTTQTPHKKSSGQLGHDQNMSTTDPRNSEEGIRAQKERGEHNTENFRYGQTVSEGGMSGFTSNQSGEAD